MASGTADLQRDLGGAIMQSIMGALLTAGFATAVSKAIASAPQQGAGHRPASKIADQVILERRIRGPPVSALRERDHRRGTDRRSSQGANWAYLAGVIAIALGAALRSSSGSRARTMGSGYCRYRAEDALPEDPPGRRRRSRARALADPRWSPRGYVPGVVVSFAAAPVAVPGVAVVCAGRASFSVAGRGSSPWSAAW